MLFLTGSYLFNDFVINFEVKRARLYYIILYCWALSTWKICKSTIILLLCLWRWLWALALVDCDHRSPLLFIWIWIRGVFVFSISSWNVKPNEARLKMKQWKTKGVTIKWQFSKWCSSVIRIKKEEENFSSFRSHSNRLMKTIMVGCASFYR